MDEVLKNNGSCRGLARVPAKWQRVFATAMDVAPEWHVRMQAAFQQHVDAAVSKTINLPKSATEADVKKAYLLAYETGCKGITVYRDGSRQDQVMNLGKSAKLASEAGASGSEGSEGKAPGQTTLPVAEARSSVGKEVQGAAPAGIAVLKPRPRPDVVVGTTQRIQTGYGSLYVTLNEDEHGIFELFATLGKSGGYTSSFTEAVSRLVSLALRSGVPPEEIVKQLDGIRSPKLAFDKRDKILSVPDALSKAIRRHISGQLAATVQSRLDSVGVARPARANAAASEGVDVSDVDAEDAMQQLIDRGDNPECPDCSATLLLQEGCIKCTNCGYSEC
jgi:ribonucleoside-diphosphate reductase alpha chain